MDKGHYIIRNDLTVLSVETDPDTGKEYYHWLSTDERNAATRFDTSDGMKKAIKTLITVRKLWMGFVIEIVDFRCTYLELMEK
jgi:hypothetical protein